MSLESHKVKLKGKTFIFKIGNYKAFGGAETQSLILARHLKAEYDARIIFIADNDEGPVKELILRKGLKLTCLIIVFMALNFRSCKIVFAL